MVVVVGGGDGVAVPVLVRCRRRRHHLRRFPCCSRGLTMTPTPLMLLYYFSQEEAARERLEERKRRQALFLHKKRRPRKVERKARRHLTQTPQVEITVTVLSKLTSSCTADVTAFALHAETTERRQTRSNRPIQYISRANRRSFQNGRNEDVSSRFAFRGLLGVKIGFHGIVRTPMNSNVACFSASN